jgi:hypothetical protein
MEGKIKLVKLAVSIIPAAKERFKFIPQEGIFLKKMAIKAPKEVIRVRNKPAISIIIIKLLLEIIRNQSIKNLRNSSIIAFILKVFKNYNI